MTTVERTFHKAVIPTVTRTRGARIAGPNPYDEAITYLTTQAQEGEALAVKIPAKEVAKEVRYLRSAADSKSLAVGIQFTDPSGVKIKNAELKDFAADFVITVTFWTKAKTTRKRKADAPAGADTLTQLKEAVPAAAPVTETPVIPDANPAPGGKRRNTGKTTP